MTDVVSTKPQPWSPDKPIPIYADRATLAKIITHHCFPVSARTIRDWPLIAIRPNNRVVYNVSDALAYARKRLKEAPRYKQGG